jgi:hypothetical protein
VVQGKATLRQREAMLRAHREQVQRTINEWTEALALLDDKIDFYGAWIGTGQRPPLDALRAANPSPLAATSKGRSR